MVEWVGRSRVESGCGEAVWGRECEGEAERNQLPREAPVDEEREGGGAAEAEAQMDRMLAGGITVRSELQ